MRCNNGGGLVSLIQREADTNAAVGHCTLQTAMQVLQWRVGSENVGAVQGAIDRGWFKTERSQQMGMPDLSAILATALELAEALEYLHSLGIVHGDLTPANVLLSDCSFAQHGFTAKVGHLQTYSLPVPQLEGLYVPGYQSRSRLCLYSRTDHLAPHAVSLQCA